MINFLRWQNYGLCFFIALFVVFAGVFTYKRITTGSAFLYSVDFTGGTQVIVKFSQPVSTIDVIKILEDNNFAQPIIREFSKSELLIRVSDHTEDVKDTAANLKQMLETRLVGTTVEIKQVDSIGAGVGKSLWWSSLYAIAAGLAIMLVYILTRFWSIGFALGAVGSLTHDAIAMLLFCLLFNYEISAGVIAAILTVLGYSINDTIIIFARIRENMGKATRTTSLPHIVNTSINETLRRTLLTTVSTVIVLVPLILFGGEVLRTLSILLMVGFIFGTYSSIYIASPLMLLFTKKHA
jgi:preprotein translocase subunit SecF